MKNDELMKIEKEFSTFPFHKFIMNSFSKEEIEAIMEDCNALKETFVIIYNTLSDEERVKRNLTFIDMKGIYHNIMYEKYGDLAIINARTIKDSAEGLQKEIVSSVIRNMEYFTKLAKQKGPICRSYINDTMESLKPQVNSNR